MKQEIKDYECPYCHEHFIMTRGKFSGHIKYCDANPKSKENRENDKKRAKERHNKFIEERNKTIKEYNFKCKTCGKEYILNLSDYDFEHHNYSDYCSRSCANTRIHSDETKLKISNGLKNSEKFNEYFNKIKSKNPNYKKNKKGEYVKIKKYYCGSKELNEKNPEISKRQSPKYFNKFIPFGLDISTLYTENFIDEYYKVKQLLYNEYVINYLSPKDIYDKYNCKEYFNNSETLLHVFKNMNFPIRNYSQAVKNAWFTGNLKCGFTHNQYKSCWHTTWNNKEVYLRSSYELDYAKELDEQQIDYEVEKLRIKYWNTQEQEYKCAIPDFYLPKENMIVEIKSSWTLDEQQMKDKMKEYKKLGYNCKLICNHKELILNE